MAISIRLAGSWADNNSTTQTVTLPTHQTGDMLIVRAALKGTVASIDPVINTAGWERTATAHYINGAANSSNGGGSVAVISFYKVAESASETDPVITWGGTANPGAAVAISYQKGASEVWNVPKGDGGGDVSSGTGHSATIQTHVRVIAGDMVDFFTGIADDTTMTVPTITQTGVTYGTVSEQPATALTSTTGFDIAADGGYRLVSSGTSSAAAVVTGTLSSSETGSSWMTVLRVNTPGFGQTQAKISIIDKNVFGQTQARIKNIYYGLGQAQALIPISPTREHGQARASLKKFNVNAFAQVRAVIDKGIYIASDTFTRSVSDGLGTADVGGDWEILSGDFDAWDIDGTQVTYTPTDSITSTQGLTSVFVGRQVEYSVDFTITNKGTVLNNNTIFYFSPTIHTTSLFPNRNAGIRASLNNSTDVLTFTFQDNDNTTDGAATTVAGYVVGETWTVKIHFNQTSPTSFVIRAKLWKVGTTEPGWQRRSAFVTNNISRWSPSAPGFGLTPFNSSYRGTFDNFSMFPIGWSETGQARARIKGLGLPTGQTAALISTDVQYVKDSFTRTESNGWGITDTGQTWEVTNLTAWSVNGTEGEVAFTDEDYPEAFLRQVYLLDIEQQVKFKFTAIPQQFELYNRVSPHHIPITVDVFTNGAVAVNLSLSGEDELVNVGAFTLDTWYYIRTQVIGTNPIIARVKIWEDGDSEPDTWDINTVFTPTKLNESIPGSVGIFTVFSETFPTQIFFDDLNIFNYIPAGYGQAQAEIVSSAYSVSGQAQAQIKAFDVPASGQSNAYIMVLVGYDNFNRVEATGWGTATFGFEWDNKRTDIDDVDFYDPGTVDGSAGLTTFNRDIEYWGNSIFGIQNQAKGYPVLQDGIVQYDFWIPSGVTSMDYNMDSFRNGMSIHTTAGIYPDWNIDSVFDAAINYTFSPDLDSWYTVKYWTLGSNGTIRVKVWKTGTQEPDWQASGSQTASTSPQYFFIEGPLATNAKIDNLYYWRTDSGLLRQGVGQASVFIHRPQGYAIAQAVITGDEISVTDTFTRTESNQLGTADVGGTYSQIGSAAAQWDVDGSKIIYTATTTTESKQYLIDVVTNRLAYEATIEYTLAVSGTSGFTGIVIGIQSTNQNATDAIGGRVIIAGNGGAVQVSNKIKTTNTTNTAIGTLVDGDIWVLKTQMKQTSYGGWIVRTKTWQQSTDEPGWQVETVTQTSLPYYGTPAIIMDGGNTSVVAHLDNFSVQEIGWTESGQAQAEIVASDVTTVSAQSQAWIQTTYYGLGQANAWVENTYFGLGQAEANIKNTYYGLGQANAWIEQTYFGLGQAMATIRGNAFGQAQGTVLQTYYELGQTQATIENTYSSCGQSNAWIERTENGSGQSQGQIKTTYNQHGQAQSDIKQTYFALGQSQATIKQVYSSVAQAQAWTEQIYSALAQAQADIKAVGYGSGQSQADIKATATVSGQAQADILQTYVVHGQSEAAIRNTYFALGQANAWIEQTYYGLGQAQATIRGNAFGQSRGWIETTYFALGQSQALIKNTYSSVGQAEAWIEQTYYALGQAQAQIKQTYVQHGQSQADILNTYTQSGQSAAIIRNIYYGSGQAQGTIINTYFIHAQAQAKINAYDVNQHGQAQANIRFDGNAVSGQAQARIFAFDYPQHGQTQGSIENTYYGLGQSQASILAVGTYVAQAQGTILQTYNGSGQANSSILATDYEHGQANAYIILSGQQGYGQAQSAIRNTYSAVAQAQAHIQRIEYGIGQAQGTVKTSYTASGQAQTTILQVYFVVGQAQANIRNTYSASGQAQAQINAYDVNQSGQAQAYILSGITAHGQAQGYIKANVSGYGQAQGTIEQTYAVCGQSQANIKTTYTESGQANALVVTTATVSGQAQGQIKTTYYSSGQAQADIKATSTASGQAQSDIKNTYFSSGQATVIIGTRNEVCGQAQATIETIYNQTGQSQGQIKQIYYSVGQAQGLIEQTYSQSAQAQAYIILLRQGYGQAQGAIRAAYNQIGQSQSIVRTIVSVSGNAQALVKTTINSYGQAQALVRVIAVAHGQAQALVQSGRFGHGQAQAFIHRGEAFGQAQAFIETVHTLKNVLVADDAPLLIILSEEVIDTGLEDEITIDTSIEMLEELTIILDNEHVFILIIEDEAY